MQSRKKRIIIITTITLLIAIVAIGLSYAYFSTDIIGNDTAKKVTVKACNLSLAGNTSETFNNAATELIDSSEVSQKANAATITITNNSNCSKAYYKLGLKINTISANLKNSYFKWRLEDSNGNTIWSGNFLNASSGSTINLTNASRQLNKGSSEQYTLRIWLENNPNADQANLFNGTFSTSNITIEARSSQW